MSKRKSRASDEDIHAFMAAVYPLGPALATAALDERLVLQEATRTIVELRAKIETFTETERLAIENGNRAWTEVGRLDAVGNRAANLKRIELEKILNHSMHQDRMKTHELNVLVKENRAGQDAARAVLDGFDKGVFLRNTVNDKSDEWAIQALPFVAALAKLAKWCGR